MKKTTVNLKFPSQFSKFINNVKQIEFEGESIRDLFIHLDESFGNNISARVLEEDGRIRPYLNLFIGKQNVNALQGMESVIPEASSVSLLLSRAGG